MAPNLNKKQKRKRMEWRKRRRRRRRGRRRRETKRNQLDRHRHNNSKEKAKNVGVRHPLPPPDAFRMLSGCFPDAGRRWEMLEAVGVSANQRSASRAAP